MVLGNLKQLTPFIKEAFQQTLLVAKFLCGIHVTNSYICTFALTQGPSMLPTFNLTGDLVLAERLSTRFEKMQRGNVVLVRSPENPRKIVIKRLMGMGGDTVRYVVDHANNGIEDTIVVPDGHVWIEGDNKFNTNDSRKFGPVPYGLVQGRVFWIVKRIAKSAVGVGLARRNLPEESCLVCAEEAFSEDYVVLNSACADFTGVGYNLVWPPEDFGSVGREVQ